MKEREKAKEPGVRAVKEIAAKEEKDGVGKETREKSGMIQGKGKGKGGAKGGSVRA